MHTRIMPGGVSLRKVVSFKNLNYITLLTYSPFLLILSIADKLNFLKVKENDFIKGDFEEDHEEDQLTGRSHRRPKRFLEDEDSDEFSEEEEASTSKIVPAKKVPHRLLLEL